MFPFYLIIFFQDPDKPGAKPHMISYDVDLNS